MSTMVDIYIYTQNINAFIIRKVESRIEHTSHQPEPITTMVLTGPSLLLQASIVLEVTIHSARRSKHVTRKIRK